jgi:hypothetical protein
MVFSNKISTELSEIPVVYYEEIVGEANENSEIDFNSRMLAKYT